MVVIYAEKSSLAKELAAFLHAGKRIPMKEEPTVGYYEFNFKGEPAVLCHGVGHLAQLVPAKSYDEKYAKWDLGIFPCIPGEFRIAAKSATLNCLKLVKSFMDKADWLICATDADREGELIFNYVCDVCHCTKPYKRLWIDALTDEKLDAAFNNLREPDTQLSQTEKSTSRTLRLAGRARDISDWLIGTNLTVAATKQYGDSGAGKGVMLTVGRVQTPTLNLVVEREKAIRNHVKTPYWKLTATFSTPGGAFEAAYENGNFTDKAAAEAALKECSGKSGKIVALETKHKKESAPLLYSTTKLQIAASEKLSWEASKTAAITQKLYEAHLITYPRTKSEHLNEGMEEEVTLTLQKILKLPEYSQFSLSEWEKFSKRTFDDSKVGSHTAIIPTTAVPDNLDGLSDEEKQLYDLIIRSLIAVIYPKVEYDDTNVKIDVAGHSFKASGKIITANGWYTILGKPDVKALPELKEQQELTGEYKITEGMTEPPKRYTEATLLAAMETAGQHLENEEARTLMKLQGKGLGTDATRAPILKALFQKGYLAHKGKSVIPTDLGIYIIDSLPVADLKSAELTGEQEMQLNEIALGTRDFDSYVSSVKEKAAKWYSIIAKSASSTFTSEKEKQMICPLCGKAVRSFEWGYGCSGYKEGCKFRVSKTIAGKKITDNMVTLLCNSGRTALIRNFKSKAGSEFDAYLVLDKTEGKVKFAFPDKK